MRHCTVTVSATASLYPADTNTSCCNLSRDQCAPYESCMSLIQTQTFYHCIKGDALALYSDLPAADPSFLMRRCKVCKLRKAKSFSLILFDLFRNIWTYLKETVHPKIYSPSCCSKPVWISFFCWSQNTIFWGILVIKQLTSIVFSILWKSMATVNYMVSNSHFIFSLHNRTKKLLQVWNNLRLSKWWQFSFLVNYLFSAGLNNKDDTDTCLHFFFIIDLWI